MAAVQKRFGTFSGVFLPNVLTIFGVILFYRLGWVTGNAGAFGALLLITLGNLVTMATALSLSAIVTNIRIGGGGAYYLVSRSLGPEMGGAVGVSLFFAQTFSISFYIIGFTKALALLPGLAGVPLPVLNLVTLAGLTLLSIFSANAAIKAQYLIFIMVMAAIASFLLGGSGEALPLAGEPVQQILYAGHSPDLFGTFAEGNFWKTFAIFFPAVTGIFAGLSLSGDLREPNKNLPRGTIAAILFTYVIYMGVALSFSMRFPAGALLADESLMIHRSLVPVLVLIGIFAATISSAIGVLLGAPRTLQALARDGIVPAFLGRGSGSADEPRVAMLFSVVLASGLLLGGSIDFVSQLLTMFFLASYGIVNLIAAIEVIIGNPAFRPKFRVHWAVSLGGAVGCFVIMFLIDQIATTVALTVIVVIYSYFARKNLKKNWGDIRKGFWASVIEIGLANFHKYQEHPRNFRPHLALLENERRGRRALLDLASLLIGKNGIVSDYVFVNEPASGTADPAAEELRNFRTLLLESDFPFVYPEIILTDGDRNAHLIALQADGIGSFKANTVVSDFYTDNRSLEEHFVNLRRFVAMNKNVILQKAGEEGHVYEDRIDVWLSGFKANISMLLMIPFLISRSQAWSNTRICLRMIVHNEEQREKAAHNINQILKHARINAEAVVMCISGDGEAVTPEPELMHSGEQRTQNVFGKLINFLRGFEQDRYTAPETERIRSIIRTTSQDARLVVLGLHAPAAGDEKKYASDMIALVKNLPRTVLVKGNQNINLFK